MKYIVEHLEPKLYKWCILEYKHIAETVGKDNLMVTNIKDRKIKGITKNYCRKRACDMGLKRICLLSQYANKELKKGDAKKFDYLLFGGILGDHPPKRRSVKYFNKMRCERRNIGSKQMSTDTAVYVAKKIIGGKSLDDFKFADGIDIKLGKYLSVLLPFRYALEDGKIFLPKGIVGLLKKQKNAMRMD